MKLKRKKNFHVNCVVGVVCIAVMYVDVVEEQAGLYLIM